MKYKNTKTGSIVEVNSILAGVWEEIKAQPPENKTRKTVKTNKK